MSGIDTEKFDNSNEKQPAVLVGLQLPGISDLELRSSLEELSRLVNTLGYRVIGELSQKRSSNRTANVLGDGKLSELAKWTGGTGQVASLVVHKKSKAALKFDSAKVNSTDDEEETEEQQTETDDDIDADQSSISDSTHATERASIAIFDCDLSPSQLRNLESALGVTVLDRTGVIIEIFSRHARTKAARLQVEIARLTYIAPRMRETGGGEDRGGGGIGGKGAGESSMELDKRKIRDRIKELKQELAAIGNEHQTRRHSREQEICVALVGYTNAGKSSLMRAMTGSEVLVADKLFATLDTTVRPLHPESRPKILLSDTVGFIKKLPHDLVASFKSTLDEALNASLLLFVVDASDPAFRTQLEVTQNVLNEVGAGQIPHLLILNKQDRLTADQKTDLGLEFPKALFLSTRDKADLSRLRTVLIDFFEQEMIEEQIHVPYNVQGIVGEIRGKMRVLTESYDETGVLYTVRSYAEDLQKIRLKMTELQKPKYD